MSARPPHLYQSGLSSYARQGLFHPSMNLSFKLPITPDIIPQNPTEVNDVG